MPDFEPIDHKDTDQTHRAVVWRRMSERLQTNLYPVISGSQVEGLWEVVSVRTQKRLYTQEFIPDGIVRRVVATASGTLTYEYPYKVGQGFVEIDGERFHCAALDSGEITIFNGDGSFSVLLRVRSKNSAVVIDL